MALLLSKGAVEGATFIKIDDLLDILSHADMSSENGGSKDRVQGGEVQRDVSRLIHQATHDVTLVTHYVAQPLGIDRSELQRLANDHHVRGSDNPNHLSMKLSLDVVAGGGNNSPQYADAMATWSTVVLRVQNVPCRATKLWGEPASAERVAWLAAVKRLVSLHDTFSKANPEEGRDPPPSITDVEETISNSLVEEAINNRVAPASLPDWLRCVTVIESISCTAGLKINAVARVMQKVSDDAEVVVRLCDESLASLLSAAIPPQQQEQEQQQLFQRLAKYHSQLKDRVAVLHMAKSLAPSSPQTNLHHEGRLTADAFRALAEAQAAALSALLHSLEQIADKRASPDDEAVIDFLCKPEASTIMPQATWEHAVETAIAGQKFSLQHVEIARRARIYQFLTRLDSTRGRHRAYRRLVSEAATERSRMLQDLLSRCRRLRDVREIDDLMFDCRELGVMTVDGVEHEEKLIPWIELCTCDTFSGLLQAVGAKRVLTELLALAATGGPLHCLTTRRAQELQQMINERKGEVLLAASRIHMIGIMSKVAFLDEAQRALANGKIFMCCEESPSDGEREAVSGAVRALQDFFSKMLDDVRNASLSVADVRTLREAQQLPFWKSSSSPEEAKKVQTEVERRVMKFAADQLDVLEMSVFSHSHETAMRATAEIRESVFFNDEWDDTLDGDRQLHAWERVFRNKFLQLRYRYVNSSYTWLIQQCASYATFAPSVDAVAIHALFLSRENENMFSHVSSQLNRLVKQEASSILPPHDAIDTTAQARLRTLNQVAEKLKKHNLLSAECTRLVFPEQSKSKEEDEGAGKKDSTPTTRILPLLLLSFCLSLLFLFNVQSHVHLV